jgi:hypothetical protein
MAAEKAFAAFISYSHATDNELGPLLQEGIEKFAKPWYRPRARRVFLDNSVLAAESDLTQAILAGLSNAEHFLLLASPASAQSPWVAREVAWWLENRDRRTLFVLLTDGAAVWDNGVLDQERTTALHAVAARTAVRAGRDHRQGALVPAERRQLLPDRRLADQGVAARWHPEARSGRSGVVTAPTT